MKLLVTGADGFVGKWLVREARAQGHDVVAAIMSGSPPPSEWSNMAAGSAVEVVHADIRVVPDVMRMATVGADAVVHLAAVASGNAARLDPDGAMHVNAISTMTLLQALEIHQHSGLFLYVSTGEVYGPGHPGPIPESTASNPVSPYAESKRFAEDMVLEWERDESDNRSQPPIVVRPFPHTGPGQTTSYVLPALAARLIEAKITGATTVKTGNLGAVRDFLDVRDVVRAYLLLLEHGVPGEVYNVASGVGHRLADCFRMLAEIVGVDATAEQDAALLRPDDIPVLIGDPARLHAATGWTPSITFDRTLRDLVDAQAH